MKHAIAMSAVAAVASASYNAAMCESTWKAREANYTSIFEPNSCAYNIANSIMSVMGPQHCAQRESRQDKTGCKKYYITCSGPATVADDESCSTNAQPAMVPMCRDVTAASGGELCGTMQTLNTTCSQANGPLVSQSLTTAVNYLCSNANLAALGSLAVLQPAFQDAAYQMAELCADTLTSSPESMNFGNGAYVIIGNWQNLCTGQYSSPPQLNPPYNGIANRSVEVYERLGCTVATTTFNNCHQYVLPAEGSDTGNGDE